MIVILMMMMMILHHDGSEVWVASGKTDSDLRLRQVNRPLLTEERLEISSASLAVFFGTRIGSMVYNPSYYIYIYIHIYISHISSHESKWGYSIP